VLRCVSSSSPAIEEAPGEALRPRNRPGSRVRLLQRTPTFVLEIGQTTVAVDRISRMKSTSSRRSAVALLLCGTLLWRSAPTVAAADAGTPMEPALLLKYAAPDLPDRSAREVLDRSRDRREGAPDPVAPRTHGTFREGPVHREIPVPDDAALRRIAGMVSQASDRMEKVESASASLLLDEAERSAGRTGSRRRRARSSRRSFSGGGSFVSGREVSDAEALFSVSVRCRPGFTPDPALFPPQVLSVWEAIRHRPLPEAELLVESLPSARRSSSTESAGE